MEPILMYSSKRGFMASSISESAVCLASAGSNWFLVCVFERHSFPVDIHGVTHRVLLIRDFLDVHLGGKRRLLIQILYQIEIVSRENRFLRRVRRSLILLAKTGF